MSGRFSIDAVFRAVDRVTAPVRRMQSRVGRFGRRVEGTFRRMDRSVGKFTQKLRRGALAVVAAGVMIGGVMGSVIRTGADFEQTMVSAAVKFPGEIRKGTAAFDELQRAARETGSRTEFSASQAAGALEFLAMAGFDAQGAIAALPGVVDLATAAGLDLGRATDIASDSLGAFNLMSEDAAELGTNLARVNDVLAGTATSANTTIEELFESIKKGAPVATGAGASIETFAALTGTLANSGIKGSEAGTALRNMFLRLQAPTAAASRVIDGLGLDIVDQNGNMLDMVDILGQVRERTADMGSAQRAAALQSIFGTRAMASVNVLLAAGSDQLRTYRTALENGKGAAEAMADAMRDTVSGRFKAFQSAVEGVKLSIFSMTDGPLNDVIDRMTEWTRANEEAIATGIGVWLERLFENFEAIVATIKNVAIGIGIFFALTAALKAFILVMTVANFVMAMNPIGLMVLGVVALVAAFVGLMAWVRRTTDGIDSWGKAVIGAVLSVIKFVVKNNPFSLLLRSLNFLIKKVTGFNLGGMMRDKIADMTGFMPDWVRERLGIIDGGGGDGEGESADGAREQRPPLQISTPGGRIIQSLTEERREERRSSEVTIRDDTGRAEQTGPVIPGVTLVPSGGF